MLPPEVRHTGSLKWRVHRYRWLDWEHLASILILQGALVHEVLGGGFQITEGRPRPAYDPKPGYDDITLVELIENPDGLKAEEVFNAVHAGVFCNGDRNHPAV